MLNEVKIDDPNTIMVPRIKVDGDWIAHVRCEGARFHVLWWDASGRHCSEKMCIINKQHALADLPEGILD